MLGGVICKVQFPLLFGFLGCWPVSIRDQLRVEFATAMDFLENRDAIGCFDFELIECCQQICKFGSTSLFRIDGYKVDLF